VAGNSHSAGRAEETNDSSHSLGFTVIICLEVLTFIRNLANDSRRTYVSVLRKQRGSFLYHSPFITQCYI
jgi:hypothetical protein